MFLLKPCLLRADSLNSSHRLLNLDKRVKARINISIIQSRPLLYFPDKIYGFAEQPGPRPGFIFLNRIKAR